MPAPTTRTRVASRSRSNARTPSLNEAFGEVVRELRHELGLSQEALSFACGRHRTYVSLLERGRNSPSLDTVWMLATALGVSPSLIIRRVEQRLGLKR